MCAHSSSPSSSRLPQRASQRAASNSPPPFRRPGSTRARPMPRPGTARSGAARRPNGSARSRPAPSQSERIRPGTIGDTAMAILLADLPARARFALVLALLALPAAAQQPNADPATQQAERQITQPLNNAPVWREVRSGVPAESTVVGRETNVLIQPTMKLPGLPAVSAGEAWRLARATALHGRRHAHRPFAAGAGGFLPLARLDQRARQADRAAHPAVLGGERIVHWSVAISFSILGVTGLVIGLGKYLLLPIIGHVPFAWLAERLEEPAQLRRTDVRAVPADPHLHLRSRQPAQALRPAVARQIRRHAVQERGTTCRRAASTPARRACSGCSPACCP